MAPVIAITILFITENKILIKEPSQSFALPELINVQFLILGNWLTAVNISPL